MIFLSPWFWLWLLAECVRARRDRRAVEKHAAEFWGSHERPELP